MVKKFFTELIEALATSSIIVLLIYSTIALPEQVVGASMEPNFYTGERILVDRISKNIRPFDYGETVVVHPAHDKSLNYIKRIVALPGDIVKIYNCQIYISREDGRFMLSEPYLPADVCTEGGVALKEGKSIRLGEDEFIVLGDNRENSLDSRFFGVVSKKDIVGRVVFRFWPISRAGFIN